MNNKLINYGEAILEGFDYLLTNYPNTFVIGQGLWSPWYVGNTMTDLDKKFGKNRIIDTPVSESACTGAAVGASLCGMRPIVVHPRMDFMLYAMDSIVNEAAKWSYMFGGQAHPNVTIRGIINRGGEQGPQHSQALHSWFAHVPGLRVVMPYSVKDARDLLIASVLCDDPVVFIDDRWLYDQTDYLDEVKEIDLKEVSPQVIATGQEITIVSSGFASSLAVKARENLLVENISSEIIDLRVLNPYNSSIILESVKKTGRLLVLDGGWKTCGISAEVLASVVEALDPRFLKAKPTRITLPDTPAPTALILEEKYYLRLNKIIDKAKDMLSFTS